MYPIASSHSVVVLSVCMHITWRVVKTEQPIFMASTLAAIIRNETVPYPTSCTQASQINIKSSLLSSFYSNFFIPKFTNNRLRVSLI